MESPFPEAAADSCSTCTTLVHDKRISFLYQDVSDEGSEWKNTPETALENCKFVFHERRGRLSKNSEKLCSFCLHLDLENLIPLRNHDSPRFVSRMSGNTKAGVIDSNLTVTIVLDQIVDLNARKDTCLWCSLVMSIITRERSFDGSCHVLLKVVPSGLMSILIQGEGREDMIGEFKHDDTYIPPKLRISGRSFGELEKEDFILKTIHAQDISWGAVKKWIKDSPHTNELAQPPTDFRLIDVEKCCVVRAPTDCEYICLSYVWGSDSSYQATFDTINTLEQPNSLRGSEMLPATIQDAMLACSSLGKRYLWVDRLCIIQDEGNNPSKQAQIDAMGVIFGGAFVTLVAVEGTSAGHGLPGVSSNSERARPYYFSIKGRRFSESIEACRPALARSKWNTRGWTYQEAMLSPRLLFFTRHALYYEHTKITGLRINHIKSDVPLSAQVSEKAVFHSTLTTRYGSAVQDFTEREFGYEGDVVNGFAGVLNSLFTDNHRFALPLDNFDYALLWRPFYGPTVGRKSRGRVEFPSWSWSYIRSHVKYDINMHILPVASWGFLNGSTFSHVTSAKTAYPRDNEEIGVGIFLWQTGCMTGMCPPYIRSERRFSRKVILKSWPTRDDFYDASHGIQRNNPKQSEMIDNFSQDQIQAGQKDRCVLGHSQTIISTLKLPASLSEHKFKLYHQDREIGSMTFDLLSDHSTALEKLENESSLEVELFALSASWYKACQWNDETIDLAWRWPYDSEYGWLKRTFMQVMAIETTDGISRRLGLGEILLAEWLALERGFKSIVLR